MCVNVFKSLVVKYWGLRLYDRVELLEIRMKLRVVTISNECVSILGALLVDCIRVLQGVCMDYSVWVCAACARVCGCV